MIETYDQQMKDSEMMSDFKITGLLSSAQEWRLRTWLTNHDPLNTCPFFHTAAGRTCEDNCFAFTNHRPFKICGKVVIHCPCHVHGVTAVKAEVLKYVREPFRIDPAKLDQWKRDRLQYWLDLPSDHRGGSCPFYFQSGARCDLGCESFTNIERTDNEDYDPCPCNIYTHQEVVLEVARVLS